MIYGRDIDLYVNRIHCYNPLTNETLAKMADDITDLIIEYEELERDVNKASSSFRNLSEAAIDW